MSTRYPWEIGHEGINYGPKFGLTEHETLLLNEFVNFGLCSSDLEVPLRIVLGISALRTELRTPSGGKRILQNIVDT